MLDFKQLFYQFYKHIIIFLVVFIVLNAGLDFFFKQQKENYLGVQTQLLSSQYQTQYKYLKIMSHDIYTMYQDNEKLINLLTQAQNSSGVKRDKIRKKTYKLLKKRYKRLVHMGVKQLHFHLKDNTSFLRMHSPKDFGDDLTKIRETVVYVNKNFKPVEGFEVGKLSSGFRFVYPLFSKDKKHIGSMEVSFLSQQIMSYMNDKFMIRKHFIILKSEVNKKIDKKVRDTLYKESIENNNYYVAKIATKESESQELNRVIKKIKKSNDIVTQIEKSKAFSMYGSYNYNAIVSTFLPISSFLDKKMIAYLIIYTESDYIDTLLVEYDYARLMLVIILLLLFVFSIYVTVTQTKLEAMAHYDKLTNLPNRAFFYAELDIDLKRVKRKDEHLAILFIDLDGFKAVNDTHGHDAGDELLIQVAHRLKQAIREDDVVGRVGGDEFIMLLSEITSQKDAILVAKKIVASIGNEFHLSNSIVQIGASIGIATYPGHANDADALVKCADSAMYVAKNNGKNNYHLYDEKQG